MTRREWWLQRLPLREGGAAFASVQHVPRRPEFNGVDFLKLQLDYCCMYDS